MVDPGHNFAFEVHQYLNSDSSGTHPGVVSPTIGVERLTAITQWAEANHQRLFLGEVGVDQQPISLQALDNMLTYIKQHTDVWSGVTYWAGGPWWGPYMFSIEPQNVNDPNNYGDKPQMGILEKHLAGPAGDYNGTPGVDSFSTTGDLLHTYGNDGNDQLSLSGNQNLLSGGDGNDALSVDGTGNDLYGDAGDDSLTALGGFNRLFGGTGNDAYFVDNTGNGVIESVGGGIDTVYATAHSRWRTTWRIWCCKAARIGRPTATAAAMRSTVMLGTTLSTAVRASTECMAWLGTTSISSTILAMR